MTEPTIAALQSELDRLRELAAMIVDPEPCWFDHAGGCQQHGFLRGGCPMPELVRMLDADPNNPDVDEQAVVDRLLED